MGRVKGLNRYQKGILIGMLAMASIFAVIYGNAISRVGYRYHDTILVPTEENGTIVYSGKIQGEQARFIVSDAHTVDFQYGAKNYGQYTLKEDPTAIPKDNGSNEQMRGIEISHNGEVWFRGGAWEMEGYCFLYQEDGTLADFGISYVTGDGVERDELGNVIDRMKPSVSTIYELLNGPQLTHKGEVLAWFAGVFLCAMNAVWILFADEIFRWNLMFRMRNAEMAEPSELEIASRYIGWMVISMMALAVFVMGLQ